MLKKILLTLILWSFCVIAAAGDITDWGTVTKIGADWGGYVVFFTGATHVGLDVACNRPDVRIDDDSPNNDKMFSIALTALSSGKEIRVYVDECASNFQKARFIEIRNAQGPS